MGPVAGFIKWCNSRQCSSRSLQRVVDAGYGRLHETNLPFAFTTKLTQNLPKGQLHSNGITIHNFLGLIMVIFPNNKNNDEIMAVFILVTELHRKFEHQFLINVMTYRLKSAIYQGPTASINR